jgi:uncharacterized protein YegJ (DUF2314 family)
MKRCLLIALILALVIVSGCSKKKEEAANQPGPPPQPPSATVVKEIPESDTLMNNAIKEARSTVDDFVKALRGEIPGTSSHSVKAAVKDGEKVEHFWLVDVKFDGQKFTGKIDNSPQTVKTVKEGESYDVVKGEISDWMYVKDGVAVGNRTLRAIFPIMKPEEVVEVKKSLGWQ